MNEIRWIKMSLQDALSFDMKITDAIKEALPNLALEIGDDIRKYLIYRIIDGYNYTRIGLFDDTVNKGRKDYASPAEMQMWESIVVENGWEVVESLPIIEEEL